MSRNYGWQEEDAHTALARNEFAQDPEEACITCDSVYPRNSGVYRVSAYGYLETFCNVDCQHEHDIGTEGDTHE